MTVENLAKTSAEQALLESEARTRAILDAAVDAIITIDDRGLIESMNPAAERLFGYTGTEIVGKNVKVLMPEPYRVEHDTYLKNYLETGQKKIIGIGREVFGLRKNLTTFPMHLAVSELRLGNRRMFTGIARDITDLRQAIRQLEESEARTRAILETAVDAIITIDERGSVESLNPAAERLFGYRANEVIGQNVNVLMPDPYRSEHDGYLRNYLTTGQKKIIGIGREVVGRRKDGTTFPMELAVSEVKLGYRRLFTGIVRDISEKNAASEAFLKIQKRLEYVLTSTPAVIYASAAFPPYDPTFVSSYIHEQLGYEPDEFVHQPGFWASLVHEDDASRVFAEKARVIERGRSRIEYRIRHKNGSYYWIHDELQTIYDQSGNAIELVGYRVDITERKRSEDALHDSEERLRIALGTASAVAFVWDVASDRLVRYYSVEPALPVNSGSPESLADFRARLHPDDVIQFNLGVENCLTGTGEYRNLYRVVRDDGSVRWLEERGILSRDSVGLPARLMGVSIDVTEFKRAEAELRESEERFRTMANAMPQLASIARADGEVIWYNQRWYEFTGAKQDQLEGWGERIHDPLVRSAAMERWKNSLATGQAFEMELPLRGADGAFRTFLARSEPLKDSHGNVVRWFGTSTDVSELKRSESMRVALTGAEIGTWHWDVVRSEMTCSDPCKKIFGIPLDAAITRQLWSKVVHPEDRVGVENVGRAALENKTEFEVEFRVILSDGSIRWIASKGRGYFDATGKLQTIEGAALDITRRKQTEQKIESLNTDLKIRALEIQEVNKDLEAFAYSVSHDLRAPLRAIDGFSKIVFSDFAEQLPEAAKEYLKDIRANTQKMGQLVDDLLLFSRLGRQAIRSSLLQTTELVQQCLTELKPIWEGRQVEIHVGELPECHADSNLLKQVWLNLLSNALKYSAKRVPSIIEIGGQTKPKVIEFFVKDNGVGFDMRYSHKLFGVFQRLHRIEDYEGTGVGLANVQRIVHRHGGRIWCDAKPDHGATFVFELPREGNS